MWTDKKLEDLRVSPEFASRIPPLSDREFRQLEENILSEGCAWSPIVSWNDVIVDGHNRYRILLKHPEIHYFIYEKSFPDMEAALAWICKNQLGRRNLTPNQRKYLIGKRYNAEKMSHGGARHFKLGKNGYYGQSGIGGHKDGLRPGEKTSERIAKEYHVSHMYVERAEKYANAVDLTDQTIPGIRHRILSGELRAAATDLVVISEERSLEARKDLIGKLIVPRRLR